jgi:hypothetical protein
MTRAAFRFAKRIPPGAWLVAAMTAYVWRMALLGRRTVIHGDSLLIGLPLFDLRYQVVFGHASALWQDTIFGGHPLFAEGQGAFASPLAMLLAALVTPIAGPIYTTDLFRFACMILTGIGTIGLTRSLGASRGASTFAALAVVFAPMWLDIQSNAALGGTCMWVPWALWSLEIWLKRPSYGAAVMIAFTGANLILAGYPQAPHGTMVYMALSLLPAPFYAEVRRDWSSTWRPRLLTGATALILTLGLSAIQLLPLAELVGESHRAGGTNLEFPTRVDYFLRGMLYSFHTVSSDLVNRAVPNVGSLIVCIAASAAIIFNKSSPRVAGHLLAALVLMQMGFGRDWPPFRFVYDHHLLFGLHYLRVVFLYLTIGTVGFGVLAAFAIDGIARYFGAPVNGANWRAPGARRVVWGTAALAIAWLIALLRLYSAVAPTIEFIVVFAAIVGIAIFAWSGRAYLIPPLFAGLLVVECATLRLHPFHLASIDVVSQPGSVSAIKALPDWQDYKVIDASTATEVAFQASDSPVVISGIRRMLASLSGSTTIRWGLHGMDGSLALPMTRRMKLTPLLENELHGRSATPPGLRFIDILGIRFIATDGQVPIPATRLFWDRSDDTCIMENTAALPRFQIYDRHVTVDSIDAAIETMATWKARTLVIENPPGAKHQAEMADADTATDSSMPPMTFTVEHAAGTSYAFKISAERPAWFFLADANYPGWKARLDGNDTPLFSAQVLGKAVGIPAGRHTLEITFHSARFTWGLWISFFSVVLSVIALIHERKRRSPQRAIGSAGLQTVS